MTKKTLKPSLTKEKLLESMLAEVGEMKESTWGVPGEVGERIIFNQRLLMQRLIRIEWMLITGSKLEELSSKEKE